MKLFAGFFNERNGEREYSHHFILKAESLSDALKNIDDYMENEFFGTKGEQQAQYVGDKKEWYFYGGTIALSLGELYETTFEVWAKKMFDRFMI